MSRCEACVLIPPQPNLKESPFPAPLERVARRTSDASGEEKRWQGLCLHSLLAVCDLKMTDLVGMDLLECGTIGDALHVRLGCRPIAE